MASILAEKVTILTTGIIFDVKRYSIHDGPGIRTTVFLKGCPLQCWWCHNPEGQSPLPQLVYRPDRCLRCGACAEVCPQGAVSMDGDLVITELERCSVCGSCIEVCYAEAREMAGREVTVAELMGEIERDIDFYDQSGGGVTFSGGEPLLQPDFLVAALQSCRDRGIHTAVDTSGQSSWESLEAVREYVDLFLYDLKLADPGQHELYTGSSNETALDNLQALSQAGESIIIRVPVIPGINDHPENIQALGALAAALPAVQRVDLLPYHPTAEDKYARLGMPYRLPGLRRPPQERLEEIARSLTELGLQVRIGG